MPLNLIFVTPGNYTIKDDGIVGNNQSAIFDGDGNNIFTFAHPADSLGFTVSTTGVKITLDITESLGTAGLTVGSLTDATDSPDSISIKSVHTGGAVVLAANNSIREAGDDAAVDVTAGSIVFSAGTGVGTGANAIEIQTTALEAETNTGGINLRNTSVSSLTIGGLYSEVAGLSVTTSGNIMVSTVGTLLLSDTDGFETVHGGSTSGNVTLITAGNDADILSTVDKDAISASGGSITVTAGRDISFGTFGANFDNDVRAKGSVTLNAGRDINLDGFADVASDDFGAGTGGALTATAGRNVAVNNLTGDDAGLAASGVAGADVVITTGAGGVLTLNAGNASALFSSSGDVIVNADRALIGATSGITANIGQVVLNTVTSGRPINLTDTNTTAELGLSDAELDRIFTTNLTIGSATGGAISVVTAISLANTPSLTLLSGADIQVNAAVVVGQTLSLFAGDHLLHTAGAIAANTFTARVDNAGDDDEAGGIGVLGSVNAGTITLSGGAEADTLRGVENVDQTVRGKGGNDIITSSGEGHYFGDGGNDTIFAGLSSGLPEVLDGGSGTDTLDTTSFNGNYTINMTTGATNFAYESFVNFENIITGGGNDTITGTSAANTIRTGSGNDEIDGGGGNDTLEGGDGDDTLNGGAGGDVMKGGVGNDTYFVNAAGDEVTELAGQGSDTVRPSITYTLPSEVEALILRGSANIDGTGNDLENVLTGNSGDNTLNGKGGADTLNGMGGDDTLVWSSADTYDGGDGSDTLKVNSGNLNLTTLANDRVLNVETINLTGGGNNILTLNRDDVLDFSSSTNTLKVLGNAGDSVNIVGAFTDAGVVGAFHKYTLGGGAILLVDVDITNVA